MIKQRDNEIPFTLGAVLLIGYLSVQISHVEAASRNHNTDLQDPNLVQNSVTGFNRQLQEDGIKNHKSSTSRQADVLRRGHEGRNCELVDSLLTSSLTERDAKAWESK